MIMRDLQRDVKEGTEAMAAKFYRHGHLSCIATSARGDYKSLSLFTTWRNILTTQRAMGRVR